MRKFLYLSVSFSLFLFFIAGTLTAQTVIQEWDFESALGDWQVGEGGAAVSISTEQKVSGTSSLKAVAADNHLQINIQNDVYDNVQDGDVITLKVWISTADLAEVNGVQIFWQGSGWGFKNAWTNGTSLIGDQWNTVTGTVAGEPLPLNRIGFQLLKNDTSIAAPVTIYVDDITISRVESSELITVDGEKDAFFETLTGPDDGYLQVRSYAHSDNGRPKNDEDLSSKIWAAWDADWFYLYEEVTDDTVKSTTTNSYQNDCIELKFDPQAKSLANSILGLQVTALPGTGQDSLNSVPDSLKKLVRKVTPTGYVIEMAINWAAIKSGTETVSVAVDSVFGLGINNHDNDGNSRQASIIWAAFNVDSIWNTPKYLGTVKFLADNKLQFIPVNNITGSTSHAIPYDGSDYFAPLIIDGSKDPFYTTLTGPDDGYLQVRSYSHSDNGRPKNDADLSSKIWTAWDADWFYLYEEVRDDTVKSTSANSYQNDCIELKIDPQPTTTANSILGLQVTALPGTGQDSLNSVPDSLKQLVRRVTSTGYVLEMAIKWSALISGTETISVAVDSVFGLGINNHDNDGNSRQASIIWAAFNVDSIWNTPKYLGTVKFLADNKLQFIPINNITGSTNHAIPYDGSNYFVPMVIDAAKDPFYTTLNGPNDGYLQVRSFSHSDNGAPVNDADLSSKIWTAWDADWFYLYEEVRDDSVRSTSANSYQNDVLELKIDPQAKDSVANSIVGLNLTALSGAGSDSLNSVPDSLKQWARRVTSTGYVLELALKWSAIRSGTETVSAAVDSVFGLGINNHDNDGNGRQASIIWAAFNVDSIWNTPKYLGTAKFLADNKLQYIPKNNMTGGTNHNFPYDGSDYLVDGIEDETEMPMVYALKQNYPNPFNPTTTIQFSLPQSTNISLVLYDVLGRKVQELAAGEFQAGSHRVTLNGANLATGVYFYRLEAGSFVDVKKLILMK